MADEVSVGPWTITAACDDAGKLSLEVTLAGEPHAKLLFEPTGPGDRQGLSRRLKADMDY